MEPRVIDPNKITVHQIERIAKLIDTSGSCWIWVGAKNSGGYGLCRLGPRGGERTFRAHRLIYALTLGQQKNKVLDHLCRNRLCVNPYHLDDTSQRINSIRGIGPAGTNYAKTHCMHGHEFTSENGQVRRDGSRRCYVCSRARAKIYRDKAKDGGTTDGN